MMILGKIRSKREFMYGKRTNLKEETMSCWNKFGWLAAGVALGTAGLKALSSKDAKKVYAETAAAALRVKESVMTTATKVKENADDVMAEAKEINAKREAEEAAKEAASVVEDATEPAEAIAEKAEKPADEE